MKTLASEIKVPADQLLDLFKERAEDRLVLDPELGTGYVQIFELEKGLQSRFLDCSFKEEIVIYTLPDSKSENSYFTIAFFLNIEGLQFANKGTLLQENIIWDTAFISALADYKVHLGAGCRLHCLSISFSKKWLNNNVFKGQASFRKIREKIYETEGFSMLESMDSSEKKIIQELLEASWKKSLGSFYIKSAVLKIICDFFYKLKEKNAFNPSSLSPGTSISAVEEYLSNHLSSPLPDLKNLAHKFSVSESTLKRHFKKRYGVNMSTYFIQKKMEYAQQLMLEKKMDVNETAIMLGYRNVNNFITMFKKHVES